MLELEVKNVIIESLQLEDISPADIDTDAPLFVEGLGLDSIDALELGVALQKKIWHYVVRRFGRHPSPFCIGARTD